MKFLVLSLLFAVASLDAFAGCVTMSRLGKVSNEDISEGTSHASDDSSVDSSESSENSGENCSRRRRYFIEQSALDNYFATGLISVELESAIEEARLNLSLGSNVSDLEILEGNLFNADQQ